MLYRIIDGIVYEGKPSPDRWQVSLVDCGNGHREACVQRAYDWSDEGPLHPDSIAAQIIRGERDDPRAAEKAEANRKRAARRAKTNVRRRCKALGLDTLLTLTYRALQDDLDLCEEHFAHFVRRLRSAFRAVGIADFCHVAAFEPQKRGAWHVHLAVHRLPSMLKARNGVKVKSFNIIRSIWRGVVGDLGGNIDVSRRKGNAMKSPAKVAAYISKYVLKMFERGEEHSRRYRWSRCEVPKPVVMEMRAATMTELLGQIVTDFACDDGRVAATVWMSRWCDVFFVAGESPPPGKGRGLQNVC